jgi:hypothetical protein
MLVLYIKVLDMSGVNGNILKQFYYAFNVLTEF